MSEHLENPPAAIDISVLFITYNRSDLLEQAYRSIREGMDFDGLRVEYVVADDGSTPAHIETISTLEFDSRILWPRNSGLGANTNRGISACRGNYILQVQDDFAFVGCRTLIAKSLTIMKADPEVGI